MVSYRVLEIPRRVSFVTIFNVCMRGVLQNTPDSVMCVGVCVFLFVCVCVCVVVCLCVCVCARVRQKERGRVQFVYVHVSS